MLIFTNRFELIYRRSNKKTNYDRRGKWALQWIVICKCIDVKSLLYNLIYTTLIIRHRGLHNNEDVVIKLTW